MTMRLGFQEPASAFYELANIQSSTVTAYFVLIAWYAHDTSTVTTYFILIAWYAHDTPCAKMLWVEEKGKNNTSRKREKD